MPGDCSPSRNVVSNIWILRDTEHFLLALIEVAPVVR
jgi:hypothetical protein